MSNVSEAVTRAVLEERGRCLWCLDQIMRELHLAVRKKLMSEAELHAANLKYNIAAALRLRVRRAIISGASPETRPKPPLGRYLNGDSGLEETTQGGQTPE